MRVENEPDTCARLGGRLDRCPVCGYYGFNGEECFDCGYRPVRHVVPASRAGEPS